VGAEGSSDGSGISDCCHSSCSVAREVVIRLASFVNSESCFNEGFGDHILGRLDRRESWN